MKRDFLKELGIAEEAIDKIMAENGRDIEAAKAKYADYDDVKGQLETAKATGVIMKMILKMIKI